FGSGPVTTGPGRGRTSTADELEGPSKNEASLRPVPCGRTGTNPLLSLACRVCRRDPASAPPVRRHVDTWVGHRGQARERVHDDGRRLGVHRRRTARPTQYARIAL